MNALMDRSPMNILLAVDGSEHALAALQWVAEMPLRAGSAVTALAVMDLRHHERRSILLAVLDQAQAMLAAKGLETKIGLLHGSPAEALTQYADEHHPDLLVLGAKGLRATLGILLGGVAQQVVEYAHAPALIVRAQPTRPSKVLIVTDGSTHSDHALHFCTHFPFPENAEFTVAHVLPPIPTPEMVYRHWMIYPETLAPLTNEEIDDASSWRAAQETAGRQLLEAASSQLKAAGMAAKHVLLRGDAATELIEYIHDHEIDLFVAGSRGLSQVKSWLLGSVSRKLIHYAGCSGLIVK